MLLDEGCGSLSTSAKANISLKELKDPSSLRVATMCSASAGSREHVLAMAAAGALLRSTRPPSS